MLDLSGSGNDKCWRAVVYTVVNVQVLCNAGNILTIRGALCFTRRTLLCVVT